MGRRLLQAGEPPLGIWKLSWSCAFRSWGQVEVVVALVEETTHDAPKRGEAASRLVAAASHDRLEAHMLASCPHGERRNFLSILSLSEAWEKLRDGSRGRQPLH